MMPIEKAMRSARDFPRHVADEHLQAFTQQMQEKLGVETIQLHEPYLPFALVRGELVYLRKLAKLESRPSSTKMLTGITVNPLSHGEGTQEDVEDDDDLQSLIDDATNQSSLEMKQNLDSYRQPAFGITHYIWVGGDCPLCAPHDGEIFSWGDGEEPRGIHPNCDCSAEPVLEGADMGNRADIDDPPIEPVYLIETLLSLLVGGGGLAARLGRMAIRRLTGEAIESHYPNQKNDYVKWKKDGQWLDKAGTPIRDENAGKSPNAHIPLDDFNFDLEIFK